MNAFPKNLANNLQKRKNENALRELGRPINLIDFSSNDYLGFSKSANIFNNTHQHLLDNNIIHNGATGSRLLSGNHRLYNDVETMLCKFHNSEAALVFNSGYDANIGFFSSVPQRDDIILYDEYIHASIRDGITMSSAKSYKFKHNDLKDLDEILKRVQQDNGVYIVTESVFSMDGDSPNLVAFANFCLKNKYHFIVDEAHAVGVFGQGKGLIQELGIEDQVFARLVTFGKGLGCHGAAILGSETLKQYLVNFARSFIYTTALPPHTLATILYAYQELSQTQCIEKLKQNIQFFNSEVKSQKLQNYFMQSDSAIHCCIVPENIKVKSFANKLKENGFDVKPILSPTVPKGQERLRFCLHSYNSEKEITEVLKLLTTFAK